MCGKPRYGLTCAYYEKFTGWSTGVENREKLPAPGEAKTLGDGCSAPLTGFPSIFRTAILWIMDNDAPDAREALWKTPGSDEGDEADWYRIAV